MSESREELVKGSFAGGPMDQMVFEAGIKLGTIYHQFIGIPLDATNVDVVERAIEHAVRVQPFVLEVRVSIDRGDLRAKRDEYDYQVLSGNMLTVSLVVGVDGIRVRAGMRYVKELRYPLMYIEDI